MKIAYVKQANGQSVTAIVRDEQVFSAHDWLSGQSEFEGRTTIRPVDVLGEERVMSALAEFSASLTDASAPEYLGSVAELVLGNPVEGASKFIGVGLNYHAHADEQTVKVPKNPILFAKFANSLIGPFDDIVHPRTSQELDFEAELAIVIGKPGKDIPRERAYEHIAGYTVVNDVTARDLQLLDRQWVRGKTLDDITPIGPWIVTTDEVGDDADLDIELEINGEIFQKSNTQYLIFDVPELVSFISGDITLLPGDIIATGTPGGVGFARDPKVFLQRGDTVRVSVEKVGTIRNTVV